MRRHLYFIKFKGKISMSLFIKFVCHFYFIKHDFLYNLIQKYLHENLTLVDTLKMHQVPTNQEPHRV